MKPYRYAILTSPLPAAIGMVRLWGQNLDALFEGRLPEKGEAHRLVRLRNADQGLAAWSADGSLLFTPHGGAGVRDAVEDVLKAFGFERVSAPGVDEDFARGMNRYQRAALAILPSVASEAQLRVVLRAMGQTSAPAGFDRHAFVSDWPLVKRWLSIPRVVIAGAPNAGKSTLFNALASQGHAIVSDTPGTTRDVLGAIWPLRNGAVVEVFDTAGLREHGASMVEAEGMRRARAAIDDADLRLVLQEHGLGRPALSGVLVATKCDSGERPSWAEIGISVHNGVGMEELAKAVEANLFPLLPDRVLPLSEAMADDAKAAGFEERWFGSKGLHNGQ
ncbi:MAG: 50S ribosome-binding GTPase [Planctomycetes bacterium]|nr:50S ribosome-binding GTPase [Planctomycetota bacterium]NUQ35272.1 50S ribosome-binding GTPase [Planctomycetaceae bacterium]